MHRSSAIRGAIDVDVLDVSDLRFAGGTSASVAEEIKAQSAAGYTTALYHVNGPLIAKVAPFHPAIRRCIEQGLAHLVLPHEEVRAKIVIIRHPAVLQADTPFPRVDADRVVIVANAAPHDIDGYQIYKPETVRQAAVQHFGPEPLWAPIGPLVRKVLDKNLAEQAVLNEDWVNIIDADAWHTPQSGWVSDRPVIGRHSRPSDQKWPQDRRTIEKVYPTDGSVRVRILGGADPVALRLGHIPPAWEVLPFGAMSPRDFLSGIDFFVYYHNSRWTEAFGRNILEALAAGVVAILPPHFQPLFGEGALYAKPADVRRQIDQVYADRDAYEAQVERGRTIVRERFGYDTHTQRLEKLVGRPALAISRPATQPRRIVRHEDRDRRTVLLISSNGSGLGHLTRLLAIARRCPPHVRPYFLSLSQAVPLVDRFGFAYEYLPSQKVTGFNPHRWHSYFRHRVSDAIGRLRVAAILFDGTWPYEGIPDVRADHPNVLWVWCRRGMWRKGCNHEQLAKASWFDDVIEPGDFAAPADSGATSKAPSKRVDPVTLLDYSEVDDRASAQRVLHLDPERPNALVALGAGAVADNAQRLQIVVEALRSAGVHICVTDSQIADQPSAPSGIQFVRDYPMCKLLPGFDLAISAAGYNSFHELLRFRVPTLFIPNHATAIDDQGARAHYAADQGLAHCIDEPEPHAVVDLVTDLLENGQKMVDGVAAIDRGNGAHEAAAYLAQLIEVKR